MAAVIGALRVDLGLNSAEFQAGLKAAAGGLGNFAKTAGIGLAAVATAAAAAGTALGIAVKGAIDHADSMGEMAQQVGVSVEALTSLGYAAKMSGSDTETLATGLRKVAQNMMTVAEGSTGPVASAFNALGISVQNANGTLRASDEVLLDVAGKFARMEDGATKTALAVQLFGRSGAELVPFLSQGREGISALTAEADRLGITISGSTANAAGAFNDTLDRISATFTGVINQIAAGVLPSLNEFGDKLADPQFAASAQAIGVAVVDGLKLAVDAINTTVGALQTLGNVMRSIGIYNRGEGFVKFNTEEEDKAILADKLAAGQTSPGSNVYEGIFGAPAAQIAEEAAIVADAFVPVIENTMAASAAATELKATMAEGQAVFTATRTPAEAYSLEVQRLNGLLEAGAIDQDTYNRAVLQAQDAFKAAESSGSKLASTLSNGLSNMFMSVVDGSKSATQAIGEVISSLARMALQKGFEWLIGGALGLAGGPVGILGGFLGGLFGFANGGQFQVGGSGGVDSQLVAFRASPNETVTVTKPGQMLPGQRPNAPAERLDITLRGLDRSAFYSGENIEALLHAIEERSADGRILNIKVA